MGLQTNGSGRRAFAFRLVLCAIAALVTGLAGHAVQSVVSGTPSPVVSGAAALAVACIVLVLTAQRRG